MDTKTKTKKRMAEESWRKSNDLLILPQYRDNNKNNNKTSLFRLLMASPKESGRTDRNRTLGAITSI